MLTLSDSRGQLTAILVMALALSSGVAQADELLSGPGTGVGLRTLTDPGDEISLRLTNIGSLTTQGDSVMNADLARSAFTVSGSGLTIGVISDSFDSGGGYATDISTGDLPGVGNPNGYSTPVQVLNDDTGSDEARALLHIVHDVAPGANLLVHSSFNNGGWSIDTAINNLVAAGANIILDDVGYLNEPFFQDGPIAQAVTAAKAAGVAYFSSAGNSGNEGYIGTFNGGSGGFHDYDLNSSEGGDDALNIVIPDGRTVRAVVQWNDPYPSVGAPGFAADYDVGLWDFDLDDYVDTSTRWQDAGEDPWELVLATNTSGADKQYGLVIQHYSGAIDKMLKVIVFDQGEVFDDDDTDSPTIFGHTAADGSVAVAAHYYGTPDTAEWFSSVGPTQILFDTDGNPINEIRDLPLLTAPDGVSTAVPGFDPFYGTSASAPHAAAVAALVLEQAADLGITLSVDELYELLFNTAVDIEVGGYDYLSGWGRIDAYAAVEAVPEPATLALLLIGALALLRRSRM